MLLCFVKKSFYYAFFACFLFVFLGTLLGFECKTDSQCAIKVPTSGCINGVCSCEDGYVAYRRHTCLARPTFTILTLLASLNSCVNPYIFLFFNPNLLQNCFQGIFRRRNYHARRYNNGSPLSRTLSHSKKVQLGVGVGVVARTPTNLRGTYNRTNSTGTTASIDLQKRAPGSRLSYHQAVGGGGTSIGEGSQRQNCPTDASTRVSPLIMEEAGVGGKDAVGAATEDTKFSTRSLQHHPQRIPSSNGFEKGYLKELSERSENIAVEMVDSTLPLLSSSSSTLQRNCSTSKQDIYSSTTTQPCRVETVLVGIGTKNHNSASTLIT